MLSSSQRIHAVAALAAIVLLLTSLGCRRHKYENPIAKDTQQPDKVLFDKAINDVERGRYEIARLTLNTLINTYDTSEFLAKAKLAIADSWYREGGSHAWAQAEAEYKDFKLFYPTMQEAAESQEKVCLIHYKQMEKPDRDRDQTLRAEEECRQLLIEYPNSKFAPQAQQMLRNIQEVLAQGEYKTGIFYHNKGSYPAAANRLSAVADQYPLFSAADESLWQLADSYARMGDRFEDKAAAAYTRIVKDYPMSNHADDATAKLQALNRPVPQADPVAYARMKYELENREKVSMLSHALGVFKHSPETRTAAKSGTPAMAANRPTIPLSVPAALAASNAAGAPGGAGSDVSVQTVTDPTLLDNKPDARQNPPAAAAVPGDAATAGTGTSVTGAAVPSGDAQAPADGTAAKTAEAPTMANQRPPTNHTAPPKKKQKVKKKSDAPAETKAEVKPDTVKTDSKTDATSEPPK